MESLLRVGVIANTHGIRGEVKVYPTTDDINRFKTLKHVILDTKKEKKDLTITGVKFFKQTVILKFKEFDNINDIERYKGCDLLVTRENAVPLEENEFFITDLIDCKVLTDEGEELGHLTDVMTTGANDVYIVETKEGKEILLPYIEDCIKSIDIENKTIIAHILPGLLDQY